MTSEGLRWLWQSVLDQLRGANIRVGDGSQTAESPVESIEIVESESSDGSQGVSAVLKTTFGQDQAVFEWRKREVVVGGEVIDAVEEDMGRKVLGAEWDAEVQLHLLEG